MTYCVMAKSVISTHTSYMQLQNQSTEKCVSFACLTDDLQKKYFSGGKGRGPFFRAVITTITVTSLCYRLNISCNVRHNRSIDVCRYIILCERIGMYSYVQCGTLCIT